LEAGAGGGESVRKGLQPTAGEAMGAWIEATGWEEEGEEPSLAAEGAKVWGSAHNGQPLLESDVRMLQSEQVWSPHVMATWLAWWAMHHTGAPAGTWIAPVGALHLAFKKQGAQGAETINKAKVLRQGPGHIETQRATHFWFPLHDRTHGWGMVQADVQQQVLRTWGRVTAQLTDRAEQWMNAWLDSGECQRGSSEWRVEQGGDEWVPTSDVHAALEMAQWTVHASVEQLSEENIEWAARLLPEVCREHGRDQDKRQVASEPPPSVVKPVEEVRETRWQKVQRAREARGAVQEMRRPANTHRHMVWQQVRAEALKQKQRAPIEDGDQETRADWKMKWKLSAEG
jgi:hypothetical protein